jgi:N-acetylneuraminate synthase
VKAGDLVSFENVRPIRPGYGCPPKHLNSLVGMRFTNDVAAGSPMKLELIADDEFK